MRNLYRLLYKDFFLTVHPTLYIFSMMGALIIIPAYPYSVIFFFGCFVPFITFSLARENNDNMYCALLPVEKNDIVQERCLLVVLVEIFQLLFSVPFAVARNIWFTEPNPVGISANLAYYGFGLIVYAIFNYLFLTKYYKTAFKVGKAYLIAIVPTSVVILLIETLSHIPSLAWINDTSLNEMYAQLPIFIVGILVYIISMYVTLKISKSNFQKVDL